MACQDQPVASHSGSANSAASGRVCRNMAGHTSQKRWVIFCMSRSAMRSPIARYAGMHAACASQGTVMEEARTTWVSWTPPTVASAMRGLTSGKTMFRKITGER